MQNKKGLVTIAFLLLFSAALIFYAVMFPELTNIIEQSKNETSDETIILIYDILPFAIGFILILGTILAIAGLIR